MTTTDTIHEIRSMRDSITHLLEDMLYKAGLHNSPEVDKEVSYALQAIAYQVHDSLPAVSPAHTPRIAKKTTAAV
jgi:hypothetical protein